MFKRGNKSENSTIKNSTKKFHKISYDEHFTRATDSIDLMKNTKFTDIGDGITSKSQSELERFTK